ncbi:MAG: hypothetical protein HYS26_02985 [Candidatus Kaiserbacteria bacterium]|nr:MAG: hypothetical protein HYS26_02985 [Candidatus Kaiserbacteria bacterium]
MGTIADWRLKIKNMAEDLLADWGIVAIVFLVALASFGLGRLSSLQEERTAVSIRSASMQVAAMSAGGLVVASRSGSTYHYPWCPGADTILERNKVWFVDEAAAKAAGLTPARNCKGLQ